MTTRTQGKPAVEQISALKLTNYSLMKWMDKWRACMCACFSTGLYFTKFYKKEFYHSRQWMTEQVLYLILWTKHPDFWLVKYNLLVTLTLDPKRDCLVAVDTNKMSPPMRNFSSFKDRITVQKDIQTEPRSPDKTSPALCRTQHCLLIWKSAK